MHTNCLRLLRARSVRHFANRVGRFAPFDLERCVSPAALRFLAIVGNEASRSLVLQLEQEAQRHAAELKPLSLVVPGRGEVMPHTRRSDHASFWDAGYPAVVLTDTANFRNPHYHCETDTVDTLSFKFLSNVAATVTATAIQIAGVRP